ncbi:MAG: histidine kinase [Proteobacteria bacterium]|nr:MAG: histidine kinase [Pseudomonadota bacterium]QKK11800.1 MAG: histidine kinase [Pseudomonadota bacterium]
MKNDRPARHGRRVVTSILGTFLVVVLLVVAAFLVTVYFLEQKTRDDDLAKSASAVSTLLRQKVEKEAKAMRGLATALFHNRALEKALAVHDRQALLDIATPLFETIRTDYGITHLYFTGPDLVNLLRMYDPQQYGDVIDRFTVQRAKELQQVVYGLELGRQGTLTLRTVIPWKRGAELLGYVELGQEIEHLLFDIRATLGVELLAFVDKQYLTRERWEAGLRLLGREGQWDEFRSFVLVAQTLERIPIALKERFSPILARGGEIEVSDNRKGLFFASLPLTNAAGNEIGRLVIVRDVTRLEANFRRSLLLATLVSVLAGVFVFLFFRSALARVERDYQRQHELEMRLLHISTEHQRMAQVEKLSALGTLTGEIAHQLNNPLVGVVNMAQLAERVIDDPLRVRKLLGEIRQAGEDCRSFVRRMLEFTKVSRVHRKSTDLCALVRETISLFRQSGGQQVSVELRVPEQVRIAVDPVLLRHALFNLLLNACQAMGGKGRIWLTLEPGYSPENGRPGWMLTVEDEGPGLEPEVMERLFDPFFTTRPEGTGLGLPVVLYVTLLHGGRVDAANREEGGARFAIWLPDEEAERGADVENPDRRR